MPGGLRAFSIKACGQLDSVEIFTVTMTNNGYGYLLWIGTVYVVADTYVHSVVRLELCGSGVFRTVFEGFPGLENGNLCVPGNCDIGIIRAQYVNIYVMQILSTVVLERYGKTAAL